MHFDHIDLVIKNENTHELYHKLTLKSTQFLSLLAKPIRACGKTQQLVFLQLMCLPLQLLSSQKPD